MSMNFGLQTYTVRRAQKKSIRDAYLPLIKMGIRNFEVARIDFSRKNAEELASLVREFGIEISAIQVKPRYVFGAVEKIIEFCRITRCKNVVISMLPLGCILGGEARFYRFVQSLDKTAKIYEAAGLTLAYHHHNWEYIRLSNGKTRMQELIERTERIRFVNDTYWTARCGVCPARQIKEFGSRLLGIHLRDLTFRRRALKVIPGDCAVGGGIIDFSSVLDAVGAVGEPYLVIEQSTRTPYVDIEASLDHLNKIKSIRGMK